MENIEGKCEVCGKWKTLVPHRTFCSNPWNTMICEDCDSSAKQYNTFIVKSRITKGDTIIETEEEKKPDPLPKKDRKRPPQMDMMARVRTVEDVRSFEAKMNADPKITTKMRVILKNILDKVLHGDIGGLRPTDALESHGRTGPVYLLRLRDMGYLNSDRLGKNTVSYYAVIQKPLIDDTNDLFDCEGDGVPRLHKILKEDY